MDQSMSSETVGSSTDLLTRNVEDPTEEEIADEEADLNKPHFRLCLSPAHISDQEAEALLRLFPRQIATRK